MTKTKMPVYVLGERGRISEMLCPGFDRDPHYIPWADVYRHIKLDTTRHGTGYCPDCQHAHNAAK